MLSSLFSLHFLAWTKKRSKKVQDCACFAQKTCAQLTKSFKLSGVS